jgi:hypothetical protein
MFHPRQGSSAISVGSYFAAGCRSGEFRTTSLRTFSNRVAFTPSAVCALQFSISRPSTSTQASAGRNSELVTLKRIGADRETGHYAFQPFAAPFPGANSTCSPPLPARNMSSMVCSELDFRLLSAICLAAVRSFGHEYQIMVSNDHQQGDLISVNH